MAKQSFTSFVGDFGNWSWVVLFAECPFEQTLDAYAQLVDGSPSDPIPVTVGQHANNPCATVVELKGTTWSLILHRVGVWDEFDSALLVNKLNSRIITFEAEDTSGSSHCSSLTPDGEIVRMQTADAAENDAELYDCMEEFEEEVGEELPEPPPTTTIDDYDDYLTEQGIELVTISLNGDRTAAIVEAGDESKVGRVAVFPDPYDG